MHLDGSEHPSLCSCSADHSTNPPTWVEGNNHRTKPSAFKSALFLSSEQKHYHICLVKPLVAAKWLLSS